MLRRLTSDFSFFSISCPKCKAHRIYINSDNLKDAFKKDEIVECHDCRKEFHLAPLLQKELDEKLSKSKN